MKHIKSNWKWLVPMIILALVGGLLSMNAGEVTAANTSADNNFKTRYSTPVTISQLEELVGSGTAGTTGQIKIHDGTDYEPKTVTASGLASGTVSSTGALSLTGTLADAKVWMGNSGGEAVAVTPSGDATITNAGVISLAANSVADTELAWLKEVFIINAGATSNSTSANATYNGTLMVQPWQNTTNAYIINTTMIANGTATIVVNGTLATDFQVQVIRTKQ
jgi:hypothetical protein